jgi:CDGSH-type Zn-finger protein
MQDEQPPVEITVYENGPVVVRGAYKLQNRDRKEIDPGRETIALCRCGLSALKPFCDGNHALRGAARSELRADPEGGFPLRQVRAPKLSITDPFAAAITVTPSRTAFRRRHARVRHLGEQNTAPGCFSASFASVAPCRYFRCPFSVNTARHGSPSVSGG